MSMSSEETKMKRERPVTIAAFATQEHLTPRHVRRLIADGLPTVKTPRGLLIRPSAGHAWIEAARRARAEAPTIIAARRLVTLERARKLKRENDVAEGKLINAVLAESDEIGRIAAARNRLRGLPASLKRAVPMLTAAALVSVERVVAETLDELANTPRMVAAKTKKRR
jgi:hypothetical protein